MTKRILIVEDDREVSGFLADFLKDHGFETTAAGDGIGARRALSAGRYDLVMLDLNLPGEDGLPLAREFGAERGLPVIILTGRSSDVDRVVGLEIGADDYISKPFNPREVLARIRAVLRRAAPENRSVQAQSGARDDLRRFAGWTANLSTRTLTDPAGALVGLTYGEFNLLQALVRNPGLVLSRERLIELTHAGGIDVFDRTIDVLVLRLRRKIEPNPQQPSILCTERGVGYVLRVPVERL